MAASAAMFRCYSTPTFVSTCSRQRQVRVRQQWAVLGEGRKGLQQRTVEVGAVATEVSNEVAHLIASPRKAHTDTSTVQAVSGEWLGTDHV